MVKISSKIMLVIFVFLSACTSDNRNNEIIKIDAEDLINEFENSSEISIKKYTKRVMRISGKIISKGFPKHGIYIKDASYVVFGKADIKGSHLFNGNTVVVCSFDKIIVHDLNKDELITVECNFKNYDRSSSAKTNFINFNKGKIIQVFEVERN
jgi:thioredoxin-related protein